MTKVLFLFCALLMFWSGYAQPYAFRDTAGTAEERADDIVKRMTLEEKIDLLSGYNDFYLHPCSRSDTGFPIRHLPTRI